MRAAKIELYDRFSRMGVVEVHLERGWRLELQSEKCLEMSGCVWYSFDRRYGMVVPLQHFQEPKASVPINRVRHGLGRAFVALKLYRHSVAVTLFQPRDTCESLL